MSARKPILLVDDSDDSRAAIELFIKKVQLCRISHR